MTTQLDIANRALLSVGARTQVSSIIPSDGSAEANAISVLWTPTYEALARAAHWNVFRKEQTLALIAAAQGTPENVNGTTLPLPPVPWLYAYSYPNDCLNFRYVVPSYPANQGGSTPPTTINNAAGTWLPTGGQIPFAISTFNPTNPNSNVGQSNVPSLAVLTNQCQAVGVYTMNQPNPAGWDSLFQAGMVASLAVFLVPALSLSLPLMQLAIGTAEKTIAVARAADGNEGVTVMDHTPDWFRARAGAQGYGWGYNFDNWGGYQNMLWPSFGGDSG